MSRCITYNLFPPSEQEGVEWLKKNITIKKELYPISLKICDYSPIIAKKMFVELNWEKRIKLFTQLKQSIHNKNILQLVTHLSNSNDIKKIIWICSLLLDSIKWKHKLYSLIINIDQIDLIKFLSCKQSITNLNQTMKSWIKCYYNLINIDGINQELIILEQLLYWKEILNTF
ncbi:DNA polymerase III subunit delta' C-terminal domain-containing protein [Buchnera aphidicola]|uniref:DNA polymerase III subunit delta' C-terminal domain-containing protein n=1 Tax=Buchnera aphidicola TaxID=9 RepID=UPI003463CC43